MFAEAFPFPIDLPCFALAGGAGALAFSLTDAGTSNLHRSRGRRLRERESGACEHREQPRTEVRALMISSSLHGMIFW